MTLRAEFNQAIKRIVAWSDEKRATSVYASAAYAYATHLEHAADEHGDSGVSCQISYILANLSGYKGEQAKLDKQTLKDYRAELDAIIAKKIKEGLN